MGPLWNFAWGSKWPPKIGELVVYFNGGTLQILLGALGQIQMVCGPRTLNKKCLLRALGIWLERGYTVSEWQKIFFVPSYFLITPKCISVTNIRTDSRFAPSQWETPLLCNDISHWLGTNLESTLKYIEKFDHSFCHFSCLQHGKVRQKHRRVEG